MNRSKNTRVRLVLYPIGLTLIAVIILANVGTSLITLSCACVGKVERNPANFTTDRQIADQWRKARGAGAKLVKPMEQELNRRRFQAIHEEADRGDALALYRLGSMYERGLGAGRDLSLAVRSYKVAAAAGVPEAQYNLGVMYAEGRGVPRDFVEAHRLFSLAATELVDARYNLAVMYERGYGVPRDYAEAVRWYRIAAEEDHGAQYKLAVLFAEGRVVSKDDTQALRWFRQAARSGSLEAQYRLGVIHDNGMLGVSQNLEQAAEWFLEAAEAGYAPAQRSIGLMYQTGRGVPQDQRKGDWWLRQWKWALAAD